MNILEETYLIHRLKPFFTNFRKTIKKMPKSFVLDEDIINFINRDIEDFDSIIGLGNIVENFVFLHFYEKHKDNLSFYRTVSGYEIDFIINNKQKIAVEVKYKNKIARTHTPFKRFEFLYPNTKKIIITKDYIDYKDNTFFIPACILPLVKL